MGDTLVLIAERDSRWIEWARAWRKPQHALVVLVPQGEESHDDFCNRVRERLERLHAGGTTLRQIVLTAGKCWDTPALIRRAEMIRSLLTRSARQLAPLRMLLDCGASDGPAVIGMNAIADAITECVSDAAPQLRVVSEPTPALLMAA